jgi:hypothetical protein
VNEPTLMPPSFAEGRFTHTSITPCSPFVSSSTDSVRPFFPKVLLKLKYFHPASEPSVQFTSAQRLTAGP